MARNICLVDGCGRFAHAFGYCTTHDKRIKLYGDPLVTKQKQYHGLSIADRFEKYVDRNGNEKGCDIWIGSKDKNGYGRFNISTEKSPQLSTRVAWLIVHKEWPPDNKNMCHTCDNPACVKVDHLYAGTQQQNMDDMFRRNGRPNWRPHKGAAHGMAKVTEAIVREIRLTSESGPKFAKRIGISTAQFYDIKNRKSWKHIE